MARFVRRPPNSPPDVVWIAGGEVDEYHISLGFYGDDLDPDELSRLLGAAPTKACRKGDVIVGKVTSHTARTGRWQLSVPEHPGKPLEPQLVRLFAGLTQDLEIWRSLKSRYRPRFCINAWIRSWNRGLEISPEMVKSLSERGLGVGVDIYADFEDHDV